MKYETLVLDIDGTLLSSDLKISDNTVKIIEKLHSSGINIVFCSGRMFKSAVNFIKYNFSFSPPVISYNGGMIHESLTHDPLVCHSIDVDTSVSLIKFMRSRNCHCQIYLNDDLITENENSEITHYARHAGVDYTVVSNMTSVIEKYNSGPVKILAIGENEFLNEIAVESKKIFSEKLNIFKSYSNYLDFIPLSTNKGIALKELADSMNFNLKKTIMIGDGENDSYAFDYVKTSVAMGNADEFLKSKADYVTETNDSEGAFLAIRDFFSDILSQ